MSDDDTNHIHAAFDAIETNVQRVADEVEAFRQEAVAKLDAIIATCDRIRDDMRRRSDTTRGFGE